MFKKFGWCMNCQLNSAIYALISREKVGSKIQKGRNKKNPKINFTPEKYN